MIKNLKKRISIPIPFFTRNGYSIHSKQKISHKWYLEIDVINIYIGLFERYKLETDVEYHDASRNFYVSYNPYFKWNAWGRYHTYYDGPIDSYNLGNIQFVWSNEWCEKCYSGNFEYKNKF